MKEPRADRPGLFPDLRQRVPTALGMPSERRLRAFAGWSVAKATVTLPQFRIIGIGSTVDEASEDALAKLREYASQYLKRLDFYRETDRRDLYPLVARFLATPEDEQLDLLLESEPVEVEPVPA